MSLSVQEIQTDVVHIEWKPKFEDGTFEQSTIVQIESFSYPLRSFHLITEYYKVDFASSGTALKLHVLYNETKIQHHSPNFIHGSINYGEKFLFKQSKTNCRKWESGLMVAQLSFDSRYFETKLSVPLVFKFWIGFEESLNRGERNVLKKIINRFVDQIDCDVQFKLGEEEIGGHITVLSAASPVFAAMFKHDTKESKTRQVVIEDSSMDTFKELLFYTYSGCLRKKLNEKSAQQLFEAGHKYDISDLMDECTDFLILCININNVLFLITWADIHSLNKLKEAAISFAAIHGEEICNQDSWKAFTKNFPELCVITTRRIVEILVVNSEHVDTSDQM